MCLLQPAYYLFVTLFLFGKKGDSKYGGEKVLTNIEHTTHSHFLPLMARGEYLECIDLFCLFSVT